jgi:hypothetical protein
LGKKIIDRGRADEEGDAQPICKFCDKHLTEIDKWSELMYGYHFDCRDQHFQDVMNANDE